jgi:elongation factor P--(R)-beta-lysine ligase
MIKNWALARRKDALRKRAGIIQSIRSFFAAREYLEVETPHRIPAPLPESHIDSVASGTWVLHPSPEICMKRLLASGYEKIYQICRCWREGERGTLHLPEFTMLEWYRAGHDYRALMAECAALIRTVANDVGIGEALQFHGHEISLGEPWDRISVREAFHSYAGLSAEDALRRHLFDEVMVGEIEPKLGVHKPAFLYDYPAERSSLARLRKDDPTVAERFELYIGGLELANAFSELADPEEQRTRFFAERENRRSMGKPVYPMPEHFLEELEAMPDVAGIALGVDRLVMVLVDASTIDEVIAFAPEDL